MASTFNIIEIGKKALLAQQTALNTVGHNLANQNNPTYSRQKVDLSATAPIYMPGLTREQTPGQIGQGVEVSQIKRIRDAFVDDRIIHEQQDVGFWETKQYYLRQMESLYNEPGGPSLKTQFNEFIDSWNDLANNPTSIGSRETVRDVGIGLTKQINMMFQQFSNMQSNVDDRLVETVQEINTLTQDIARLTNEIKKVKGNGDNPNDLMDSRDAMIEQLSKLVDVQVHRYGNDEMVVYINGQFLVQGGHARELAFVEDYRNEGHVNLVFKDLLAKEGKPEAVDPKVIIKGGALRGLIEVRDVDLAYQIKQLDNFSATLIHTVNDIHKDGFGLNFNTGTNFFSEHPITENADGTYLHFPDRANPKAMPVTANYHKDDQGFVNTVSLFKVSGTVSLSLDQTLNINGTLNLGKDYKSNDILVTYTETDRVRDVIDKINRSGAEVVAYLNHKDQLTIKALPTGFSNQPDFVIQHLEDSGQGRFLTDFTGILRENGENGAFDWKDPQMRDVARIAAPAQNVTIAPFFHPSSWISLDESIVRSPQNIAAASGVDTVGNGINNLSNAEGDGSNALRMVASLIQKNESSQMNSIHHMDTQTVMLNHTDRGFNKFLDKIVQETGAFTRNADHALEKSEDILGNLVAKRQSISGVNADEEAAHMLMYQHGYQAAARLIAVQDQLLDLLINRMV